MIQVLILFTTLLLSNFNTTPFNKQNVTFLEGVESVADSTIRDVRFELVNEKSFESVKNEAIAENKIIFVDMYADWCGPCRQMDATVFNQTLVAKEFNTSFINYKVDIEQAAGKMIARQYNVNAYPTYFFLKPNGEVLYRLEGVFTPAGMIEEAEFAKSLFD
jgi:thioredoxin 1